MADPIDQQTSSPQSLVDAALGTNPVVAPLAPLAPLTQNEPVVDPIPTPAPTPAPTSVPMGDDTPLAFAMPSSTPTQTVEPMPNPVLETQQSSYLPPVPPAPTMAPEMPKKKSKVGVVVVGILLMVMAVGGGVWGYSQFNAGNTKQVAIASPLPQASAEVPMIARLVEDTGKAIVKQTPQQEKKGGGQVESKKHPGLAITVPAGALEAADEIATMIDAGYAACNAKNQGKDCLNNADAIAALKVLAVAEGAKRDCANGYMYNGTECVGNPTTTTCGRNIDTGAPVCCDSNSTCEGEGESIVCEPPGRKECKTGTGADAVWCTMEANSSWCGGSKTGTGDKTNKTSPTMSCSAMTYTPTTTPVIGSKLTFTCAGAVVPATAGTLSYKFRYSINSGTAVALANKTATTAELNIAACGTYSVECQACATLGGVLTCDPIWTGATTP